jgi:hypothetical protein
LEASGPVWAFSKPWIGFFSSARSVCARPSMAAPQPMFRRRVFRLKVISPKRDDGVGFSFSVMGHCLQEIAWDSRPVDANACPRVRSRSLFASGERALAMIMLIRAQIDGSGLREM